MKYILLLLLILTHSINAQRQFIVVIDAGHGGHDSGAVGYNGIKEKDITLALAFKLKEALQKNNITAVLTRDKDVFIPLRPKDLRAEVSNKLKPNLFISIHLNASGSFSGSGAEIYISKFKGADDNKRSAVALSLSILDRLKKDLGFRNRGIQFGDFSVIRNTINTCPSILIELGYISNLPEMEFILGNGSNLVIEKITESIISWRK